MRYRHVAVLVGDDLRTAEDYYRHLFGMEVVLREAMVEEGEWAQLPSGRTWDDAEAAGAPIGMVALQRDDVILPLFASPPTGEQIYAIGLVMTAEEMSEVEARLEDETVETRLEGWLAFVDRYGVRWQLSTTGPFRGAGAKGHWLDV